jgi:hypothetical protein
VGREDAGKLPLVLNSTQVEATRVVTFAVDSIFLSEEIEDSWGCTIVVFRLCCSRVKLTDHYCRVGNTLMR